MDPNPEIMLVQLTPGDRILFYTDGLIEARDLAGAWIELDEALLGTLGSDSFEDALGGLLARLEDRAGPQQDDLALLLVECLPPRDPQGPAHPPA
jgi:serine phosphatase RsbU (regulator of sigma subunit)